MTIISNWYILGLMYAPPIFVPILYWMDTPATHAHNCEHAGVWWAHTSLGWGLHQFKFYVYVYQLFCNMLFFLCYKGKGVLFIIGVCVSNSAISCLTCILKIKAYLLLQRYQMGIWPNIFNSKDNAKNLFWMGKHTIQQILFIFTTLGLSIMLKCLQVTLHG